MTHTKNWGLWETEHGLDGGSTVQAQKDPRIHMFLHQRKYIAQLTWIILGQL